MSVGVFLHFWGYWNQLIWRQYGTWLLCSCYWLLTDLAESQTTLQFYFFKESNWLWAAFSKAHCSRITCLFPDLHSKQAIKFDPAPKVKLGKVNPHTRPEYLVDYKLTLGNFLTGYRSSMIQPNYYCQMSLGKLLVERGWPAPQHWGLPWLPASQPASFCCFSLL